MSFIHYVLLAGAVVIGGIISATTLNLLTLFFGKIIGLTLMRVSLYIREGYRYEKGDRFKWNKKSFSPIPQFYLFKKDFTRKDDIISGVCPLIVNFLIYLSLLILIYTKYKTITFEGGIGFLTGMVLGALICVIMLAVMMIADISNPANRELTRLYREQIAELKNGAGFDQIPVYPERAADEKASKLNRAIQWNLCIYKALVQGNFKVLPDYLKNMDDLLKTDTGYTDFVGYLGCYYNLLFYSSFIYPNRDNAIKIYNVIKNRLEADTDANGRRVLAAYQMNILNRPDLAAVTLYQAEEALKKPPEIYTAAEAEFDRKYIREMKERLSSMSRSAEQNTPVMSYTPKNN